MSNEKEPTQEPSVTKPIGNAVSFGDIELYEDGEVYPCKYSIVISFDNVEDFSRAVRERFVQFKVFGE